MCSYEQRDRRRIYADKCTTGHPMLYRSRNQVDRRERERRGTRVRLCFETHDPQTRMRGWWEGWPYGAVRLAGNRSGRTDGRVAAIIAMC
jgi:hypothetical protein